MPDILILPQRGTSNNPVIQFTGSAANSIRMEVLQSGSVAFLGKSGSLFSIVDSLQGSLMAVSDISGLPILEVFSDDRVVMGKYNSNALVVTGSKVGVNTATPGTTGNFTARNSISLDTVGYIGIRGYPVLSSYYDRSGGGNYDDIYGNIRVLRSECSSADGMYIGYNGSGGNLRFFSNSGTTEYMTVSTDGQVYAANSFRAPIFYDSNNTGCYTDPAGNSTMQDIYLYGWYRSYNTYGLYNQSTACHFYSDEGPYYNIAPNTATNVGLRLRTQGYGGTTRGYFYADTNNDVGILNNGGNWRVRVVGGDYTLFDGSSIRAQIFYDSNDTNYYLNPNGTSWIGYPTYIGGSIALTEDRWINNKYFSSGGTTYLPFIYDSNDTTYYIDPANVSYLYEPRMAWRTLIGEQSYDATLFDGGTGYRSGIVVRGNYPHIDLVSSNINNGNHGPTLRFVAYDTAGATSGNFKHWVMGCAGTNAIRFSIGYDANQSNPHYGIYGAGTTVLWIENDSNVFFNSSIRPTIMYDRNNTSYYVDPASTSYLYTLQVGNTLSDPNNNGIIRLYGNLHIDAYNGYDIYANYYSGRRFRTFYSSNTEAFRSDTDGIVYAYNQFRTPVFYDYNNTNYYVDPDSTSVLNTISLSGVIRNNGGVNDDDSFGIYWDSGTSSAYAIYREAGAWNYPYPDLRIAFHTGIKLGAAASYQGIKFYNDYDMATQVMSVNNGSDGLGANNVYVNNSLQAGSSLRAPTFYDSDNTSYYTDPASTSVVNNVQITTLGVGTAASGTGGEIRATNNITAYYSDERLKTKLGPIENPIEKVKSLSGFYFSPNDTAMALGYKKTVDVGVSAQQVKEILPEIIAPAPIDPQYMTVRYEKLIPLLIEAIKEQQGQIDDLKNQISTLLSKNG
jgi:hypothetical protein